MAWRNQREGYVNRGDDATSEFNDEIRFLGLYDPVDQALYFSEEQIAGIVEYSALGVATNFIGTDPDEISRHYWFRLPYENRSIEKSFIATHSAFQGSPTYSTDSGIFPGVTLGIPNHPSAWLDGYTDAKDIAGSIAIDTWFRQQAISRHVPITLISASEYEFNSLWPDPNPESPNHIIDWNGDP